ncbi:hypothetical protein [uncultured Metabacillus sp.]|nr:hypothetical protein [uncultured Metabacillus sp.]
MGNVNGTYSMNGFTFSSITIFGVLFDDQHIGEAGKFNRRSESHVNRSY